MVIQSRYKLSELQEKNRMKIKELGIQCGTSNC